MAYNRWAITSFVLVLCDYIFERSIFFFFNCIGYHERWSNKGYLTGRWIKNLKIQPQKPCAFQAITRYKLLARRNKIDDKTSRTHTQINIKCNYVWNILFSSFRNITFKRFFKSISRANVISHFIFSKSFDAVSLYFGQILYW